MVNDATAHPDISRHGTITRLAPSRSRRRPSQGAVAAATRVSAPYADEADSLYPAALEHEVRLWCRELLERDHVRLPVADHIEQRRAHHRQVESA